MTRFLAIALTRSILLTVALLLAPIPAQAQRICGYYDTVVENISKAYREVRVGNGLSGPKTIFEIYANETTGTWTILKVTPNGWACIMAVGTNWNSFTPESGAPT